MSLVQGNNTPTRPRIEPGYPDPESDALTTRPVRSPNKMVSCMHYTNEIQKTVSRLIRIYSSGTRLPTPMSQTHSLNLQSDETGSLYVPFSRTVPYCGVFTRSVPRLWNSLRQAVRNSESENAFKNIRPRFRCNPYYKKQFMFGSHKSSLTPSMYHHRNT